MKTSIRESKWRTPEDARRARRVWVALLGAWFVIDFLVWFYWHPFWSVLNGLMVWTGGAVLAVLELSSAGGWISGWCTRDRSGGDG